MRRLKDERMRERKIRQKTDRTKRSWTDRSLSLLCVAAMLAGVVLGPLETTDVMASESVLTCTQAEHTHGDGCYQNQLTCGKNEHTHGDGCFNENGEVVCGQEEHGHTGDCYTKVLACTQAEHTHSGSCYTIVEPETTPQTTAETTPQTTAETTAQTTAETTPQTTAETTAQTTAETTAQTAAETTPQTQESIIVESTETVQGTEAASESETAATELKVSATTDMKYAVAGKDALTFTTKVSGGTAPLTVKYEIKLDGKTVYEQNEYAETVSWMPTSYGEHTLYMTVTDAAGKTTRVDCTIPVSVNETENGDIWRQSVQSVTLTGEYGKDIAAIAKTQIGTKENKKNFIINKEGKKEYYSRYGQWYGDTYEEWSAMFVSFCAEYAGIPASYLPREKEISKWIQKLGNLYESKDGHTPEIGDLVFFSENTHRDGNSQIQNGNPSHVGIVIDTDGTNIWTVEGNCGGAVAKQQYSISDEKITGYVSMDRVMELAGKITVSETEAEEDTETESESESESEGLTEESTESESETEETTQLVPEKIIITADDVNLRAEPTIEAEVIAVVDNGTELELLGAVEAEDGIWYRVNYVETETVDTEETGESQNETVSESQQTETSEVLSEEESSDLPAETTVSDQTELTSEETALTGVEAYVRSDLADVVVPETEEETPDVMTYEDDEVIINVTEVAEGAIPENVTLQVVPLKKDDAATAAQYAEVEANLLAKAENEEYDIAGFLAYDITFVDENGEKIEPNGEVKVSMEYKQPTMPEEVTETVQNAEAVVMSEDTADGTETLNQVSEVENPEDNEGTIAHETAVEVNEPVQVTVMHLEENSEGIVQNVVDMTENSQLGTLDTTDAQEIQKAEFVTDSFSAYTVTWTVNSYKASIKAVYGYLKDGKFIGFDKNNYNPDDLNKIPQVTQDKGYVLLDEYANTAVFEQDDYIYQCAKVSLSPSYSDDTVHDAGYLQLRKKDGKWRIRYRKNEDDNYDVLTNLTSNTNSDIYVYYIYVEDELTEVATVDHTSKGITMRMIDYSSPANNISIGGGYNKESGEVTQGLLNRKLSNGYPVTTGGASLASLFNGGTTVNHLFLQSTYDSTGYFEYSSFDNYAYLGSGSDFTVYQQIGTPSNGTDLYYRRGNFMPYNKIASGKYSTNTNDYDENGNELTGGRKGEQLYITQGNTDFYFGMYMEANFVQPENGISSNGSPMIFNFNGDDDLWIYIDDVLVLDIGGIHDAHSGYINFVTGEVVVNITNASTSTTTIKQCFQKAGVFPDGTAWNDSKVDEYFVGNTFNNFSAHTMKMFYMERGAGASNLHMKFNLEVVPEGQITVRKDLSNTDKEKYANEEFKFKVYAQKKADGSNDTYTDEYEVLTSAENGITAVLEGTNIPISFDDDGIFTLKPGQGAVFSGLKKNRKYYVKEIGVKPHDYSQVLVNGTTITEFTENQVAGDTTEAVETGKTEVYKRPLVVFTNRCSGFKSMELRITKRIVDDLQVNDTFTFKVQLEGTEGSLIPYSEGEYYLKDTSGNYYFYNSNGTLESNGTTSKICGYTDEDGVIRGVPAGYTVAITGILSGTDFKVEEVNLDSDIYDTPKLEIKKGTYDPATLPDADAMGSIKSGKYAEVTVTNYPYRELQVSKVWSDGNSNHPDDTVCVGLYKVENSVQTAVKGAVVELNASNNWTNVFGKLAAGDYAVKELRVKTDSDSDTSIAFTKNGISYIALENESLVSFSAEKVYKVTNGSVTWDSTVGKYVASITNTLAVQKVKILKYGATADQNKPLLEGAVFKLYGSKRNDKGDLEKDESQRIGEYTSSNGGILFDNVLPYGTYYLKETMAPEGYVVLSSDIIIEVSQTGVSVSGSPAVEVSKSDTDDIYMISVTNNKVYSLPSTGGRGIYWYLIGGMLLMMAASLILYKNKCKEVLKS